MIALLNDNGYLIRTREYKRLHPKPTLTRMLKLAGATRWNDLAGIYGLKLHPPRPGSPVLKCNVWLATEHLDNGVRLCHLQKEYERRYERETKYILAAPRSSMEKAIKSERARREDR